MKSKLVVGVILFSSLGSCRKPTVEEEVAFQKAKQEKKSMCILPQGTKTIISTEYYIVACTDKECQVASVYKCKRFDLE